MTCMFQVVRGIVFLKRQGGVVATRHAAFVNRRLCVCIAIVFSEEHGKASVHVYWKFKAQRVSCESIGRDQI